MNDQHYDSFSSAEQPGEGRKWDLDDKTLLAAAQLHEGALRRQLLGPAIGDEAATSILIGLFVSVKIDMPFGLSEAARLANCSVATASRWIAIMAAEGVIDAHGSEQEGSPKIRLSSLGASKVSAFLRAIAHSRREDNSSFDARALPWLKSSA